MLVLARRKGQTITIGDRIRVTVVDVQGAPRATVRLGIDAPRSLQVSRHPGPAAPPKPGPPPAAEARPDEDNDVVWLRSHPDADGVYRVQLELGPDDVIGLDERTGPAWAAYVVRMLVEAEYDAAVIAQLRATGLDLDSAAAMITGMREARRGVRAELGLDSPIPDLDLVPGVSQANRGPFLTLYRRGAPFGQWAPAHARHHATGVLEILEAALLDEIYRRTLTDVAGLDTALAERVVDGLNDYRETAGRGDA